MNLETPAGQMQMFSETQAWLAAEFRRLRRLKQTPRVKRAMRELTVRCKQLGREVDQWMIRHA